MSSDGTESNGSSYYPAISGDGRYVAFYSLASNLLEGDTHLGFDLFVHDRLTGETTGISGYVGSVGVSPALSYNGRYVAFESLRYTNGPYDVFVHDRLTGETTIVSVAPDGTEGNGSSRGVSISGDGRYLAFSSGASNLIAGDTNGSSDIFVHDRETGETSRVNVASDGTEAGGALLSSISGDGRYVSFVSWESRLVGGDWKYYYMELFVHDRLTAETIIVSVAPDGTEGNGSSEGASISGDSRYVVFRSSASNLVAGDTNGLDDIFVAPIQ